ncbi:MAG: HAD-IA family hydrolase [Fimbriimonadaceae bacterium]|nr:HAD-IA family hydrolase [Fimbriimonadaceae bacterium]
MSRSSIRLVCFDVGGVLSKLRTVWDDCARAAGLDGVPPALRGKTITDLPFFDAYQAGDLTDQEFLVRFADLLETDTETALAVHQAILVGPYEGTEELVDELNAAGVATGCLSNTNEPHWRVMHEGVLLPQIPKLRFPAASHTMRLHKPDPAIYRAYEAWTGCAGPQILFFEDGPKNVEGARACGWDAVLIDPHADPAAQMRRALIERGVLS